MPEQLDAVILALGDKRKLSKSGGEYWMARDIQSVLGYSRWENFEKTVQKARQSCESAGVEPKNHFREVTKMIEVGKGAMVPTQDLFLTRYACYLVAMNGDTGKSEIATAQAYFAIQTRIQEVREQLTGEEQRIQLRERVRDRNKSLASTAKQAGVQKFAIFQAAGYQGLYEMGLAEIKRHKGIGDKARCPPCSQNARPRKALVRCAQSRANLATPSTTRKEEKRVKSERKRARRFPVLAQRAVADSPR